MIQKLIFIFILFCGSAQASESEPLYNWFKPLEIWSQQPSHVVTFVIVLLALSFLGFFYRKKLQKWNNLAPSPKLGILSSFDFLSNYIFNLAKSVMGEDLAIRHFPYVFYVFLLILFCNLLGAVPGFFPPTANLNTTLAFGLLTFLYYNIYGIIRQGPIKYAKHFFGPVAYLSFLILPIELVSHVVRPIALALRLRGNISGDHLVLEIFSNMVPYIVPVIFLGLGIFVAFIQAFVFSLLTMVYISMASHSEEH